MLIQIAFTGNWIGYMSTINDTTLVLLSNWIPVKSMMIISNNLHYNNYRY